MIVGFSNHQGHKLLTVTDRTHRNFVADAKKITAVDHLAGMHGRLKLGTETRRCYFWRRVRDVKVHVVLIAVVQLGLFLLSSLPLLTCYCDSNKYLHRFYSAAALLAMQSAVL